MKLYILIHITPPGGAIRSHLFKSKTMPSNYEELAELAGWGKGRSNSWLDVMEVNKPMKLKGDCNGKTKNKRDGKVRKGSLPV